DLETTLRRIDEAEGVLTQSKGGRETALNTPIQGALHGDLRERSAREVRGEGDIYPIGGVVPLMKQYRFDDLVDVVMASKSGLGADVPVHLFGTGHPMVFGFAAAMGCDLFDSAAYALYAENGRYLTFEGTQDADDLKELPCSCPVCRDWEPDEVTEFERLCQHNLNISFAEMRRVRQSIRRGELLEHIERRCRSHPTLLDGLRRLYDYSERIETSDPSSKSTFFYLGSTSSERPEVLRHHRRLDRFEVEDEAVVTTANVKKGEEDTSVFRLNPPFGPYPPELEETYPVNAETPEEDDYYAVGSSLEGVLRLVELNPDARFVLEHPGWEHPHIENLEDKGVETRSLDRDTTLTETDENSGRESGDDDGDEKGGG
ncbi:MAG: tRNA guanosine(15) transglycosylase TgtA, partial [Halobacteria archaeon]|nr:tRNA guanosine(15) transglycosylase TgtA [Halobacteria archaeon]